MTDHITQNRKRAATMVTRFFLIDAVVLGLVGLLFCGVYGLLGGLLVAAALTFLAWSQAAKITLRLTRTHPADPRIHARLINLVEGLCVSMGVSEPGICVVDDTALNACAVGRDPAHTTVVVTTGLLDTLERVELEAVLAQTLSRVKNQDVLVATLGVTLVAGNTTIADVCTRARWPELGRTGDTERSGGAVAVLGVIASAFRLTTALEASLVRRSLPADGVALADDAAVSVTRYPPALVAALDKLEAGSTVVGSATRATAPLWIAHPLARTEEQGRDSDLNNRFATHPPLHERIERLREY